MLGTSKKHIAIFSYGKDQLTAGLALRLCRGTLRGEISWDSLQKIKASRKLVEEILNRTEAIYGINTGFGPLCTTRISTENTNKLQYNILKSHSVGVGTSISKELAKLMLILKLQALAQGFSGIKVATLERIKWHIEEDIIPLVPEQGSVGASGDLAPLAHLFLPLIGLGKVWYKGKVYATKKVFQKEGLIPVELEAKEGLALINGTQFIAANAVKVIESLHSCLSQADIIGAMMIEGLLGSSKPFLKELHQLRPFPGNKTCRRKDWFFIK